MIPLSVPSEIPLDALTRFVIALGDDELVLGHRNSEWTGYGPILEEDIAFSNIAQDELGHSLAWYSLNRQLGGRTPDWMAFERAWRDFTSCRFVSYPRGDFAYTVVRQYLFDAAEQVRMQSLMQSAFSPVSDLAAKILAEEGYHLLHSEGLVLRLGDATDESHRRMQAAVSSAFPQALGIFEEFPEEEALIGAKVLEPSGELRNRWLAKVVPVLKKATLSVPVREHGSNYELFADPDNGGRTGRQTEHLRDLVSDMQKVYQLAPGQPW